MFDSDDSEDEYKPGEECEPVLVFGMLKILIL